ncbi:MAG: hypothetical protein AUH85_01260 [Chloroflexi bacterium 13_1_40CM_4_68_4]|nr:MAG: hypothetical protein AUH85_01260 [Chloroflexi bacterium 13_1_40CM_4_68_4]
MRTLRFGLRAFFIGLVVGLLLAPRPGQESRNMLRGRLLQFVDATAELLALAQEPISPPERTGSRGT